MKELMEWQPPDFSGASFESFPSKVPLRMVGALVQLNVLVVTDRWLEPEAGDLIFVAGQVAAVRSATGDRVSVFAPEGAEFLVRKEAARVVVGLLCPAAFPRPLLSAIEGLPEGLVATNFGGERVTAGRSKGGGAFPMRVSQGNRVRSLSSRGSHDD